MPTTTIAAYGNEIDTQLFAFENFNFKTVLKLIIAHDSGVIICELSPLFYLFSPLDNPWPLSLSEQTRTTVTDLDSR